MLLPIGQKVKVLKSANNRIFGAKPLNRHGIIIGIDFNHRCGGNFDPLYTVAMGTDFDGFWREELQLVDITTNKRRFMSRKQRSRRCPHN